MNQKKCIVISGPTASGKTAYAISLALKYNTAIISADSRQCFRELNIGVAKPSLVELQEVKHYFINSLSINEEVNASVFEKYALQSIHEIFKENNTAVMAGGTGLYIKAFCEGLDDIPGISPEIQNEIRENYKIHGILWLEDQLKNLDPHFAEKGEMQNPQRMLRALEVVTSTGQSILDFHSKIKTERPFLIEHHYIDVPRNILYENINMRTDKMIEAGLVEEARNLYPYRDLNALQTVGYKELFEYFDKKIPLEKAVDEIKKNTRHFAKRQITWFRKFLENYNYRAIKI
ncbi:MAG: tRNA (adenosine(37)-N6)-dimethylallyltransferase MiaA [Ginsengibacter sp.]